MAVVRVRECDYGSADGVARELAAGSGLSGRVLVKPNLLSPSLPERAETTHPSVVRGAVEGLLDSGCEVLVGDSSAGQHPLEVLLDQTGVGAALEGLDWEPADVDHLPAVELGLQGFSRVTSLPVSQVLEEVDGVLNLPKFKTHMLTGFTGAAKNFYGLLPRKAKKEYHARLTSPRQFSAMVVDLAQSLRGMVSEFTIMDAVVGMEGNGPHGGDPVELGLLAAGGCFDVDHVLLGMVPGFRVFTDEVAVERGLTGEVELDGPRKELRIRRASTHLATRLTRWLPNVPVLSSLFGVGVPGVGGGCTGCRTCMDNCPVDAIAMKNGKARIDRSECIKCFTCMEVCPVDAIETRKGLL